MIDVVGYLKRKDGCTIVYDEINTRSIEDLENDLERLGVENIWEELKKHNINELPADFRIDVFFQELKGYFHVANQSLIPFLRNLQHPNKTHEALHSTFHCMYLWVGTLTCLNSELHFQAFASGLRSLLELHIDMHLLSTDAIQNGVEKYHQFTEVEKYRSIKKTKELCKANGIPFEETLATRNAYLNHTSEVRIDEIKSTLWGRDSNRRPISPSHWSGLSVPDRASKLGKDHLKRYLQMSDYCSWYIHSGPVGHAGARKETFNDFAGFSIMNAAVLFSEAIRICLEQFRGLNAVEITSELKRIEFVAGYKLVIEEIKQLKQ